MSAETTITLEKFSGLNLRSPPAAIEDNELSSCINFDLGPAGELKNRTAVIAKSGAEASSLVLGANTVTVLAHFLTPTYSQIIVRAGTNLYYTTDWLTWTVLPGGPHGNVEWAVQYVDKLYLIRSDATILLWDGAILSSVTGSPVGSFAIIHRDRLFVLGSASAGALSSRLYFSNVGNLTSTGWVSTNFIDIRSGDGDFLVAASVVSEQLLLFKGYSSWLLTTTGLPENWTLRNASLTIGCISKHTIKTRAGLTYFLNLDGVYKTDGLSFVSISDNIAPVFYKQLLSTVTVNKASAFYWQDKYVVRVESYSADPTWGSYSADTWESKNSILWGPSASEVRYLVYHFKNNGWTEWKFNSISPNTFVEVNTTLSLRGVYGGSLLADGTVYKYGNDIYGNQTCSLETKEFTFDLPEQQKRGKWLGVVQESTGITEITSVVNKSIVKTNTLVTDLGKAYSRYPGPGYFRTWRFKLLNDNSMSPITFYSVTMALHKKRAVSKVNV